MTITLTKFNTQVIWRSPDVGGKDTSIPGSVPDNKGYQLDIKTTMANGETHTITPTSGTVGGEANFTFTLPPDENCNLQLVSDADNANWIIRCLCCVAIQVPEPPTTCGLGWHQIDGVGFMQINKSQAPSLWPADSPLGTFSVWIYPDSLPPFPGDSLHDIRWTLVSEQNNAVNIDLFNDGHLRVILVGNTSCSFTTVDHFLAAGSIYHVFASWDTSLSLFNVFINGEPVGLSAVSGTVPSFVHYSNPAFCVFLGGNTIPTTQFQGDSYELWLGCGQYVADPTGLFIDGSGDILYLGRHGELPTGTSPTFYFTGAASPGATEPFYRVANSGTGPLGVPNSGVNGIVLPPGAFPNLALVCTTGP